MFNTENYTIGIQSIYSDIPGAGPGGTDLISYSLDTPFGDFTIPTTFDAITATKPVSVAGSGAFAGETPICLVRKRSTE